jgi:hypothetical protein
MKCKYNRFVGWLSAGIMLIGTLNAQSHMNHYKVYFSSKGTGSTMVLIDALNSAGAIDQVKARYPGAYSISTIQVSR